MDIIWTKVIVAILFGLFRLTFGLLPLKLYSFLKIWQRGEDGYNHVNRKRQRYVECCLTLVQSFGGGVLLATCFLHMMPEVYHAIRELEEHYETLKKYPFSQLIICIGFFMVYFVEEFSQYMISKMPTSCPPMFEKAEENIKPPQSASSTTTNATSATNKVTPVLEKDTKSFDEKCIDDSVDSGLDKSNEDLNNVPTSMPTSERELIIELEKSPKRLLRCCLITLALSFHAVFEGIAIGLQHSVSNIWYLFIAISIHSVTLLFCVGVELLFSHKRKLVIFLFVLVLSVTSPIGILIGLAVTTHTDEEDIGTATASALLEGLSAGTLLYITFFEVLSREKERREFRFKRGMCIIAGFSIMALLQTLE
ncbi:Zinc/iron regulated transporter-related protein 89B [Carabus blaptoides fortunei]